MLFVLNGDIQTGKTRWLCDVCEEVASLGVMPFGVVAPGIWRRPEDPGRVTISGGMHCAEVDTIDWTQAPPCPADKNGFEKLGIVNTLLPGREGVLFALRRDVAAAVGKLEEESQSEKAKLGWHMSDGAISRVDGHFRRALEAGILSAASTSSDSGASALEVASVPDASSGSGASALEVASVPDASSGSGASALEVASVPDASSGSGASALEVASVPDASSGSGASALEVASVPDASSGSGAKEALLVVDELGRLELMRGEGLVSAMRLLEQGPTKECPYALVVVRSALAYLAEERFGDTWGGVMSISADESGRGVLLGTLHCDLQFGL